MYVVGTRMYHNLYNLDVLVSAILLLRCTKFKSTSNFNNLLKVCY